MLPVLFVSSPAMQRVAVVGQEMSWRGCSRLCRGSGSSACSGSRSTTPNPQGKKVKHPTTYQPEQPCCRTQEYVVLSQRKTGHCMVQHSSPVAQTREHRAEKPAHLHSADPREERVVVSQSVCTGRKRHILLRNNSLSTIWLFAPTPKVCWRGQP